jgi:nucleotide-binding universal stress UspA family protein
MQRPSSLVVGYDGSESAKRALERAASLVGYGARLAVVHVAATANERERSGQLLAEAVDRLLPLRVFAQPIERIGEPAEELMQAVRERDADLLVVGNGKTALERFLLGSVSTTLVHRAPCDVLVVR